MQGDRPPKTLPQFTLKLDDNWRISQSPSPKLDRLFDTAGISPPPRLKQKVAFFQIVCYIYSHKPLYLESALVLAQKLGKVEGSRYRGFILPTQQDAPGAIAPGFSLLAGLT